MLKRWKEEWEIFPQSKLQDFVACIPRHLCIICFLKGDNKYRERRVDGRSDTKRGKQLLAQLKADMAVAESFETLRPEQIAPNTEDKSFLVSSTSSEDEDSNAESDIEDSNEKEAQGNYNINKIKLKSWKVNSFIDSIALQETPTDIRSHIDVESGKAHVDDSSGYTSYKQRRPTFYKTPEPPTSELFTPAEMDILDKRQKLRRPTFYKTPEPPTPEPFTPTGINILDKRQKLRRPKLYSTPEPPTPEPFTPLEDKIAIFQQTPMKEAISLPELSFIKRKTCQTKAAIMKIAAVRVTSDCKLIHVCLSLIIYIY